jgi:hypothetical protein
MILKGNKRGGATELALHLLNDLDNDHIEIHELRGFSADNLEDAFKEAEAVARGTRCKKFLFSLSLSPPGEANVSINIFESAINRIEEKLGLEGQPRAIVFHEKDGRRHAHCVWSRIDSVHMKAIDQPHFKLKLRDVAKQLYIEQGWKMPRGFLDSKYRDLQNFTMAEFQQAKRYGEDVHALRDLFQECWAVSDNKASFEKTLEERGFQLAQGDKRGFLALDFFGRSYSLTKYIGIDSKEMAKKIGPISNLMSITDVQKQIFSQVDETLKKHIQSVKSQLKQEIEPVLRSRAIMREKHRTERSIMQTFLGKRAEEENIQRASRLSRGLKGIWHKLTGKYQAQQAKNEEEKRNSDKRDREQKQFLIEQQLKERRALQTQYIAIKREHREVLEQLRQNSAKYLKLSNKTTRDRSRAEPRSQNRERGRGKTRDKERER